MYNRISSERVLTKMNLQFYKDECLYTELSDDTVEINRCDKLTEHISIPSRINNKTVVGIASREKFNSVFKYNNYITCVNLPNTLKYIGYAAFADCIRITEIHIPQSVTSIGKYAFVNCRLLTRMQLPNKLKCIEECAFWSCHNLCSIDIPIQTEIIGRGVFGFCYRLDNVCLPDALYYISDYLFFSCKNLTNIHLPENLLEIGEKSFSFCEKLKHIRLPRKLKQISNYAFYNCCNLENIIFSTRCDIIEKNAFIDCGKLKENSHLICSNKINEIISKRNLIYRSPIHVCGRVKIVNKKGIHARPASIISEISKKYSSKIQIRKNKIIANANVPLEVIRLGISKGDFISIQAIGQDAKEALLEIINIICNGFGESDN